MADPKREVRKLYDEGRVTYLIDMEGRVRYKQEGIPDNSAFLKAIDKL